MTPPMKHRQDQLHRDVIERALAAGLHALEDFDARQTCRSIGFA